MNGVAPQFRAGIAIAMLAAALATGCDDPADLQAPQQAEVRLQKTGTGQLPDLAAEVRQATARFHSTVQATNAGYAVDSPCVSVPGLGGMGFHWVNLTLADPVFDPLAPETVLYEPGPNGQLRLVGLEYVVIDVGQPAPTFAGQPFDVGGAPIPVAHWTLHVWVHKDNPAGLFAPFNPDVVCP